MRLLIETKSVCSKQTRAQIDRTNTTPPEALITEETLSSSRFYELAGLNQPQQAENQLKNNDRNKPALAEKPAVT